MKNWVINLTKGIYSLIAYLDRPEKIKVGSLGKREFPKGYYVYTGSALNNLEARIERHKKESKKLRWHIDYLLQKARILKVVSAETNEKLECRINERIYKSAFSYIPKFGCSDCKCESHLCYFESLDDAAEAVGNAFSIF